MNIGLNENRPCMRFSIGKLALSGTPQPAHDAVSQRSGLKEEEKS